MVPAKVERMMFVWLNRQFIEKATKRIRHCMLSSWNKLLIGQPRVQMRRLSVAAQQSRGGAEDEIVL